ncbi:MAG: UvrD-helicase domain-containing protein [Myxococcales bacterium]|nr:MAG: UvrD-helicase domain-containing protein [Myxococcales bacterium]
MVGAMVDVSGLNAPQRQAVEHGAGPLVVFAGAGSGKTRVITHRIAHLVSMHRVRPYNILAVTFTNKAAAEMRERIEKLLPGSSEQLWVGTFHAICAKLLRFYSPHTGVQPNFVIYDDSDQRALITRLLRDLQLDERRYAPKQVAGHINRAKQEMKSPQEINAGDYYTEKVKTIYEHYEAALQRARALDFGDLIYRFVRALEGNEALLKQITTRFGHVLVDEFQDTNHAQLRLVKAIAEAHRNVCVVGDDDQSIYRWRGADRRNILDFSRVFGDARVIKLEQNYRSSQRILRAADAVISRCYDREPKTLWTENEEGAKITLVRCLDERDEARMMISAVRELEHEGMDLSNMVVFYRIHAQSRVLEEALRASNIPYQIIGGMRFYERAEIKDLLAYLRVIANPSDDVSLLRIVNVPARGIGKTTLNRVLDHAHAARQSVWESLGELDMIETLSAAPRKKLTGFVALIKELQANAAGGAGPLSIAETLLERITYTDKLKEEDSPEADARLQNVQEFLGSIMDFERDAEEATLENFLELVTLQSDKQGDQAQSKLSLMTVHSAKGLEFPVVLATGMEEGMFPFKGIDPGADPEELEEERRLAYVAFTRAKERLFLSYAAQRRVFGQLRVGILSRFAEEIPDDDVNRIGQAEPSYRPHHFNPTQESDWQPNSTASHGESYIDRSDVELDSPQSYKGTMVQHAKFGIGKVIDITDGIPPKVTVIFPGWGQKKIAANFLEPA